jgi:N-methylhydantoinase B
MKPALVNPGTDGEISVRKINYLKLSPGDRVRITTSGGGGYGNPLERDIERVRVDVELGFVSRTAAEAEYGVVLDANGRFDERATNEIRQRKVSEQTGSATGSFSLGDERSGYDALWSADARDALGEILSELPILMRYRIKNELHQQFFREARVLAITRAEVANCWSELRSRLYPDRYLARQFLPKERALPQVQ